MPLSNPPRRHRSARLAGLVMTAVLASAAHGQAPQAPQAQQPRPTPQAQAPAAPETTPAPAASANVSQFRPMRISRVIGMPVHNPQGAAIGKVHDLMVNTTNGRVRYVVVAFDPAVLAGDRLVPVPVSQFRRPQRDALSYNPKPDRLEKVAIRKADWNDAWLSDPQRLAQLDRAWGLSQRTAAVKVRRGSTLPGQQVRSPAGEVVGEIEDVVVHMNQQKANYAIVHAAPAWAGQDKHLAVPMTLLRAGAAGGAPVLAVDKAKVQAMKGLAYEQQQNPTERAFVADINRHLAAFSTAPAVRGDPGASPRAAPEAPPAQRGG